MFRINTSIRVVVEAVTSETKTRPRHGWPRPRPRPRPSKLGLEAGLETEAGSRDPVDKVGTSETKTETESWAAETKTETEAIKIRSLGRPRDRGRSSRPPSLLSIQKVETNNVTTELNHYSHLILIY